MERSCRVRRVRSIECEYRSARVRVLERSSTSTSAQVLDCVGSDLRVKLENRVILDESAFSACIGSGSSSLPGRG